MTVAVLDYKTIRQAVLQLPQQQRLQLIKDAILTLPGDESSPSYNFDFEATLSELQRAFATIAPVSDQDRDDARYAYLLEKHGA